MSESNDDPGQVVQTGGDALRTRVVGGTVATRYVDNEQHHTIGELVAKFAADPDPLNVLEELALSRALLVDFIRRYEEFTSALLAWYTSFRLGKKTFTEDEAESMMRTITEYAIFLKENDIVVTDRQVADLERAKRFVEAFRKPVDEGRPRKVVDILEARLLIETISKLVQRLDSRETYSEIELNQIFTGISRVIDVLIPNGEIPAGTIGAELKAQIRMGWMRVVTR